MKVVVVAVVVVVVVVAVVGRICGSSSGVMETGLVPWPGLGARDGLRGLGSRRSCCLLFGEVLFMSRLSA